MDFAQYIPRLKTYTLTGEESQITEESVASLQLPSDAVRLLPHARACFAQLQMAEPSALFVLQVGDAPWPLFAEQAQPDAYTLTITPDALVLRAQTARGFFYGLQLLQTVLTSGAVPCCTVADWAEVALRAEYLDLRAFCPTFEHLLRDIKRMAWCHSNAVVIEYEDKLPFVHLSALRNAAHCYTPAQMQQLCETAQDYFVDIIPLQQSFGHLEYVLKHPAYRHLRECEEHLGEMNPLHPESMVLSKQLLQESIGFHPNAPYIHIGCDEVWSLGKGAQSRASGHSRQRLFIDYVNQLIAEVCAQGKTPIMWHDMLFDLEGNLACTPQELGLLDRRVILAIWLYNGNTLAHQVSRIAQQLDAAGIAYLGAGAVRCWDSKPVQHYPVATERVHNINQWAQLATRQPLQGVIMTNWIVPFTLGSPYSLYETAIYLSSYAAEQLWGGSAQANDFLERFYQQYHGVVGLSLAHMGYQVEDYYTLAPQYAKQATQNADVLQMIATMVQYKNIQPIEQTLFRVSLYPDCIEERESLATHAAGYVVAMQEIRPAVAQAAYAFLPPHMAEAFVASRFDLPAQYQHQIEHLVGEQCLAAAVRKHLQTQQE